MTSLEDFLRLLIDDDESKSGDVDMTSLRSDGLIKDSYENFVALQDSMSQKGLAVPPRQLLKAVLSKGGKRSERIQETVRSLQAAVKRHRKPPCPPPGAIPTRHRKESKLESIVENSDDGDSHSDVVSPIFRKSPSSAPAMVVVLSKSSIAKSLVRRCCPEACDVVHSTDIRAMRRTLDMIKAGFSGSDRVAVVCAVDRTPSGRVSECPPNVDAHKSAYWVFLAPESLEAEIWKECFDARADDVVIFPSNVDKKTMRRLIVGASTKDPMGSEKTNAASERRTVGVQTEAGAQSTHCEFKNEIAARVREALDDAEMRHDQSIARKDFAIGRLQKKLSMLSLQLDDSTDECKSADEKIKAMGAKIKRMASELKDANAKMEVLQSETCGDKEALTNATSLQKLSKRRSRLKFDAAIDYMKALFVGAPISALLHTLKNRIRVILGAQNVDIYLRVPGNDVDFIVHRDPSQNSRSRYRSAPSTVRLPSNAGIAGDAVERRCVQVVEDVQGDERYDTLVDGICGKDKTKKLLCFPVTLRSRVAAVMLAANKLPHGVADRGDDPISLAPFTSGDVSVMQDFATLLLIALEKEYARVREALSDDDT